LGNASLMEENYDFFEQGEMAPPVEERDVR
jgi:hypothetical protein